VIGSEDGTGASSQVLGGGKIYNAGVGGVVGGEALNRNFKHEGVLNPGS